LITVDEPGIAGAGVTVIVSGKLVPHALTAVQTTVPIPVPTVTLIVLDVEAPDQLIPSTFQI